VPGSATAPLPIDRPVAPVSAYGLDPASVHLNHGSFGACPRAVLAAQDRLRARLEAAPMRFFVLEWQPLVDAARARLASFVGADPDGLVFVPNTTTAVSTVLASLELAAGDELLATDHTYRACRNALDRAAARAGARVVVVPLAFPVRDPDSIAGALAAAVTARTRLALIDHITSATGLVLDLEAIAAALAARGVPVLVDGAHVPGQLPLDVADLARRGVTYYVGNCHKWVCAPKGAAFLWVDASTRDRVHPLTTSHGASLPLDGRSRFQLEHDWTGTHDPSAYLTVPAALDAIAELGGSWPAVMERNHRLAVAGRDRLGELLGAAPAAPAEMLGALATVPVSLPAGLTPAALERQLLETGWEVPIVDWPALELTAVRIAAQLYNHLGEVEALGRHLHALGVRGR
jgi:isopenicillin-N epimerase